MSFDYGPTSNYGANIVSTPASVTGGNFTAVSANIPGLSPSTTYHFRVDGANAAGSIIGTDLTFTTPSNNASLSNLVGGSGVLSPAFSSAVSTYNVAVSNATASITIAPTVAFHAATVTVNGTPIASGQPSSPINLATGPNAINVVVTAQDGVTTRTYTVIVTRDDTVITTQSGTQADPAGGSATFAVGATGTGPFTYQWYFNGTAISGATTPTYTVNGISSNNAGNYWVVVTNVYGATTSSTYTLTVSAPVPAMPRWGWFVLPSLLLMLAARFLPKRPRISGHV